MLNNEIDATEASSSYDVFVARKPLLASTCGANEDTTRLRAIDVLLVDVLGWGRSQIETEKYVRDVGYADYALGGAGAVALVVEAKRNGVAFTLPGRVYSSRPIGFSFLESECCEAARAVRQATGYATELGAKYAVATNGSQWIMTLSFVAGEPIVDRSVLVFESLDAIDQRFSEFFSLLGPDGILANTAGQVLSESRRRPAPRKLSATIPNYPVPARRNTIANELSTVIGLVWDGMERAEVSEPFLRQCYVRPQATVHGLQLAAELIAERSRADDLRSYDVRSTTEAVDVLADTLPEKPILVLGRVGHGKSTFLRYLRAIQAKDALSSYLQLEIDFLDRPDNMVGVPTHIYREIEEQLQRDYSIDIQSDRVVRGVLHSQLSRFRGSPRGVAHRHDSSEFRTAEIEYIESITTDRHEYLKSVFRHVHLGQNKSVAIFLDNLDRRSDKIQEEAFLRASAMARDWGCLVFVCLRPGTFYRSRNKGVLDSLAPKVMHVSSPDPAIMLKKRFEFAARIARGEDLGVQLETGKASRHAAFDLPTVAAFLDCCLESFWKSKPLVQLFEAASNGNPRDLLRLVSDVLSSNHLNTGKIIKNLSGGYRIPVHEALRALLYGDSMHFSPKRSRFVNLFDIDHDDCREHFGQMLLLSYLQRTPLSSTSLGYVETLRAEEFLGQIGYSARYAASVLERLFQAECIEGRIGGEEWSDQVDRVRITSLGRFHINSLLGQFQYVDAVIIDTPITSEEVRAKVSDTRDIHHRIERARLFVAYLSQSCRALQDADAKAIWEEAETALKEDIKEVERRLGGSKSQ